MILSVQKAMKILTVISDSGGAPITLAEISAKTGFPKPTCSHLIETLCFDGYVKRVSHTKGYVLGPATHYLSRYGRYENKLISLIRPIMSWMERKTRATVILSVIQNNQKYIIAHIDKEQNLFEEHPLIRTDDIYRTATGRAILAEMNRDEVKAVWENNGAPLPGDWDEVKSYEDLEKALKEIRAEEIVITKGSKRKDSNTKGFAVPLFKKMRCIGAIGLAWTKTGESEEELCAIEEKLCDILRKGAKEIQRRLSYEA